MKHNTKHNHDNEFRMSLGEHLEELRARIIRCIIAVALVFLVTWFFKDRIITLIIRPHVLATSSHQINSALKFRSYLEPITAQLKACAIVALILTSPWLLFQMWGFIAPGLYQHERSAAIRIAGASLVCFIAGVGFGYFLFIPLALEFLLSISGPMTQPVLMIGDYLSLFFIMTFALGIAFQTPLVMYQLVKWDIVTVESIQKHRKGAILTGFILAAVLTPPDPMTQIMMALPLIAFYDLGALAAAPSRTAMWDFSKFAGIICLIGALSLGYYYYLPIGRISPTNAHLQLSGKRIDSDATGRLYRGQKCTIPSEGQARLSLGTDTHILLAGPANLRANGSHTFSLTDGKLFIRNQDGAEVEIRTPTARVIVKPGKTQISVNPDSGLNIQVLNGEVEVRRDGETSRIPAGRTATFQTAGTPLKNPEQIEQKWEQPKE